MSDSECNFCTWQRLQREAEKKGHKLKLVNDSLGYWHQGKKVVDAKTGEDIHYWFAEVSNKCAC